MQKNKKLIARLEASECYQEFEQAFSDAVSLPLNLRPLESWRLPHSGKKIENSFCAIISQKNASCAACLRVHANLVSNIGLEPATVICHSGMSETAVPVLCGQKVIGYLQTGQVFRRKPTEETYQRASERLTQWGFDPTDPKLREAYFSTPVLSAKKYAAAVALLQIYGRQLSAMSNQILAANKNAESPTIVRVKKFINKNLERPLVLEEIAREVSISRFYLCKIFKKETKTTLTDYISRTRIEKAKSLLLNPSLRVGEVAYTVGFHSLTHFNRVFKNLVGASPSVWRIGLK